MTIDYRMLNQFGRFVPLNKSSLDMELDYSPDANDYFDESQLSKMNKRSVRTAGGIGLFVASAHEYLSTYALVRKMKQIIDSTLANASGNHLFEAVIIENRLDSSWFMLHSVQLIKTLTPEILARQLYKCQSGRVSCIQATPNNKDQLYKTIYIIVSI